MEATLHGFNSFATLTYSEDRVPVGGSLVPRDLQLFFKRLRKAYNGNAVRYFAVGEYGDQSARPHYHAALFGLPPCENRGVIGSCVCGPCSVVRETWGSGHVMLGELSTSSAAYIAGYVVKKWTSAAVPALNGRHPEFARMSLRPGIGAGVLPDVALGLIRSRYTEVQPDVPTALRHGSTVLPLGRYLTGKLREELGRPKQSPSLAGVEELRLVREYSFSVGQSVKQTFVELAGEERPYQKRGKV